MVIEGREVPLADHRGRVMAAETADIDPVHEHVVGGLGDQRVAASPGSVGVQQLVHVGRHFFDQGLVARVIVVVHQHLQPGDRVAGVEVVVLLVLQQPGELADVLPRQPGLGEGVVVHHRFDHVIARVADRLLMVGRIEMVRLQADLHGPAGDLPDAVQPLVAALEAAAIFQRLRGEVSADVDDLHGRLDVLQFDREGRRDFGHEGELEARFSVAQHHGGLRCYP